MSGRTPQVGDTITTAEELDALPDGATVLDAFARSCQRLEGETGLNWWRAGHRHPKAPYLPAVILHLSNNARGES